MGDFNGTMDECFTAFDKDGKGLLKLDDFSKICSALFRNEKGSIYPCSTETLKEMFDVFDANKDGFIDKVEFKFCWDRWIKKIVRPVSALLVIDVQNDFISGSLSLSDCPAKHNGEEVIKPINALLDSVRFDAVFYSLDWHPSDHASFVDNVGLRKMHSSSLVTAEQAKVYDEVIFEGDPPIKMRLWPRHCVQESWGAELHKDLKVMDGAVFVHKGTNAEVDSFSAFFDNLRLSQTCLDDRLREMNVSDVYVCGLAYDVCVGATAADALNLGYRTVLLEDCCRGITEDGIKSTRTSLTGTHAVVTDSQQVKAMIEGADRRPEMGYKLCLELKAEIEKKKDKEN